MGKHQRRLHFFNHNNELTNRTDNSKTNEQLNQSTQILNSSFSNSTLGRPSVEAVDERKTRKTDWELHHGIYAARRIYSKRWSVTPTVNHRCMEVRSTTFVPRGFSAPPRHQSPAARDFGPSSPRARNLWNPGYRSVCSAAWTWHQRELDAAWAWLDPAFRTFCVTVGG